jgi:hypothetical protein
VLSNNNEQICSAYIEDEYFKQSNVCKKQAEFIAAAGSNQQPLHRNSCTITKIQVQIRPQQEASGSARKEGC